MMQFVKGSWTGLSFAHQLQTEEDGRTGIHRFMTTLSQSEMGSNVLQQISYGDRPYPRRTYLGVIGLSCILNGGLYFVPRERFPRTYEALLICNRNLHRVYLISMVVSSFALIRLGNRIYGSASLVFILIGLARTHFSIPQKYDRKIDASFFLSKHLASIYAGSLQFKLWGVANTAYWTYMYMTQHEVTYPEWGDDPKAIDQVSHQDHYLLDPRHYNVGLSIGNAPDIDYVKVFIELFESVCKTDSNRVIQEVRKDPHWKEEHRSDEIEYLKKGARSFLTRLRDRKLKAHGSINYSYFETKVKFVAKALQERTIEDVGVVKWLIDFGLQAHYCLEGKISAIDEAFFIFASDRARELTFESKIYRHLIGLREQNFRGFYYLMTRKYSLVDGSQNPHELRGFRIIYSRAFDLPLVSSRHRVGFSLTNGCIGLFFPWLVRHLGGYEHKEYDADALIVEIQRAFAENELSWEEFRDFLVEKTGQSQVWVQRNCIDDFSGNFKPEYVGWMLAKLGVLRLIS